MEKYRPINVGDKIHLEQDGTMIWAHLSGAYGPHVRSGYGATVPDALRDLAKDIEEIDKENQGGKYQSINVGDSKAIESALKWSGRGH